MQLVPLIFLHLTIYVAGLVALVALGLRRRLELIGASYIVGSGLIALVFFLNHWVLHIPLNGFNVVISTGLVIIVSLVWCLVDEKKRTVLYNSIRFNPFKLLANMSQGKKLILATLLIMISSTLFENYFWPVTDWDAVAFYDFRARVMAIHGSMIEGVSLGYFFQYPPYTSFLHVFGYVLGTDRVKLAYSFIYISLLITFYALVRRKQEQLVALFFTLLLASTPMIFEHATTAYSNLAFTAFYSLGIIYLWYYFQKTHLVDLVIGSILVGLSTWVRSTEPFWIVAAIIIGAGYLKSKKHLLLHFGLIGWLNLPDMLWRRFLSDLSTASNQVLIETSSHSTSAVKDFLQLKFGLVEYIFRTGEILAYLAQVLSRDFLILFCLLTLSLIGNRKNKAIEIASVLLLLLIIFAGTFVFSFTFDTWNAIGGSIARMSMIFIPLILFIIGTNLHNEKV